MARKHSRRRVVVCDEVVKPSVSHKMANEAPAKLNSLPTHSMLDARSGRGLSTRRDASALGKHAMRDTPKRLRLRRGSLFWPACDSRKNAIGKKVFYIEGLGGGRQKLPTWTDLKQNISGSPQAYAYNHEVHSGVDCLHRWKRDCAPELGSCTVLSVSPLGPSLVGVTASLGLVRCWSSGSGIARSTAAQQPWTPQQRTALHVPRSRRGLCPHMGQSALGRVTPVLREALPPRSRGRRSRGQHCTYREVDEDCAHTWGRIVCLCSGLCHRECHEGLAPFSATRRSQPEASGWEAVQRC